MSYNGWSNRATWQVAQDILNHHQWDDSESITVEYLKELVDNVVFNNSSVHSNDLMREYAWHFLKNVNWGELAEVYQTDRLTQKLNINGN